MSIGARDCWRISNGTASTKGVGRTIERPLAVRWIVGVAHWRVVKPRSARVTSAAQVAVTARKATHVMAAYLLCSSTDHASLFRDAAELARRSDAPTMKTYP